MEPLSLTLRGAHSETMTKGCPLVVPWLGLVQNVSPCAAWDLQQQIQNQIPLGSGTLGTQRRHRWTLYQAYSLRHLSPWGEPRASLLAGKHGAGEEGNARPSCTRGGAGMPIETARAGDREQGHHVHGHRDTTAPDPEEQLVPLSVIPPLWLARGGTFPCHKHPGRASPSASAHAARPRLLRCCCWLLQHLPQTSQQFQPRVIFPDQTHPTVQLPPRPSGKH